MAEWLKTKGLHKLCSLFEGVEDGSWHVRVSEKLKQYSGNFPEGGGI